MRTVLRGPALLALVWLIAVGCSSEAGDATPVTTAGVDVPTTTVATTNTPPPPLGPSVVEAACDGTVGRPRRVPVRARAVVEASGLGVSRNHDGVLWAHNDSGDTARVFALGEDGGRLGTFRLAGARATDWEDLAIGPGADGRDALYLADIGDNAAARQSVTIYRVPEPEVTAGAEAQNTDLEGVEAYPFMYPDGPRDAEALFVDGASDSFYVIEKSLAGGPVGIYRGPLTVTMGWDADAGALATLERVGTLSLPPGPANAVTSADMTPAGGAIAVRTYGHVLLWDRPEGDDVVEVLAGPPCEAPVPVEVQGEAIALVPDASGYVTLPEGASPSLSFFRPAPATP